MWFNNLSGHGDKTMIDIVPEAHALMVTPSFKGQPLQLFCKLCGAHRIVLGIQLKTMRAPCRLTFSRVALSFCNLGFHMDEQYSRLLWVMEQQAILRALRRQCLRFLVIKRREVLAFLATGLIWSCYVLALDTT